MNERISQTRRTKIAGWSAIVFVVSVASLNLVENIGSSRPDPTGSGQEVARWAADADAYLWATTLLVPISWVCLVVFAATLWELAHSGGVDRVYPILGVMGAAMTMGTLSAAIASDAALIASVEHLSLGVVELLASFASVLFLLNWTALAIALFGFSRTTSRLGLTPRWLDRLSAAGAAALVIGSAQSGFILNGFLPGILIGFAGFLTWLFYLFATGLRMTRTNPDRDPTHEPRDVIPTTR